MGTGKRPLAAQLVRVVADAAILIVAFVAGLGLDYLTKTIIRGQELPAFSTFLWAYTPSTTILIGISLVVFSAAGFYSRGRRYLGRYKALIVTQATALSFLLYTAVAYALRSFVSFPPASSILWMALVAVGLLVAARLYSSTWKNLLHHPSEAHDWKGSKTVGDEPPNRVLVIGGGGYIGSALLPRLLAAGKRVRILDSFLFGTSAISEFLDHPDVQVVEGDFRRIDQLVSSMSDVDTVVHLGGIVGDPACALDEELTVEVNLTATRAIAEVARARGIQRFVFASTCSVYGASDLVMDEHSQLNPVSLYAKSKVASERVLHELADSHFKPTVLRFGTVYGLSGRTRFDLVVNLLSAKAVEDGVITVFGPDQWRPFVHVADVAQAVSKVVEAPLESVGNRVFNVGSNEQNTTLGDLGRLIQTKVPTAELVVSDGDGDRRNYRVNFDRIRRELGFKPEWSLTVGIDQVIRACRSGTIDNYQGVQYSNVKSLQEMVDQQIMETHRKRHLDFLQSITGFVESSQETQAREKSAEWIPEGAELKSAELK